MNWTRAVAVLIVWFVFSSAEAAYPKRVDARINDFANIILPNDEIKLRESIAWLKRTTNAELVIVTLPGWRKLNTPNTTWESFSTNFFNTWRLGNKQRNDGILLIAALEERKLRIELGAGFKRCYDSVMKQLLERDVVPLFKEARYGQGLVRGATSIIRLTPKPCPTQTKPVTSSQPKTQTIRPDLTTNRNMDFYPRPNNFNSPWLPIGGVLLLSALGVGATQLFRPKPRLCQHCSTPLELLSEQADDEYLNEGQKLEEQLQSVNYDVLRCPNCNNHELRRRPVSFSSFDPCPSCNQRTASSKQIPQFPASFDSDGLARVERECKHCQHQDSTTIVLPRLKRSNDDTFNYHHHSFSSANDRHSRENDDRSSHTSSNSSSSSNDSSSDSSGGGRSNGGGASADW